MVGKGASEPEWHLSRGGKVYGPLPDKEFSLLIEKGRLKPDDLIWRPGFDDWRLADSVLGRSSPPPIPNNRFVQRVHSKGRGWKFGLSAVGVMTLVAALYIAWPYYTLWKLKHAIETKDSLALESRVDFPRIRDQFRSDVLAARVMTSTNEDEFGALGTALGAAMVGPLIESFVHPATIFRMSDNSPDLLEKIRSLDVRRGYFIGPMTFRFDVEGPVTKSGDDATKLGLILEFQGSGWRVTHIDFPWEKIQAAMSKKEPSKPLTPNTAKKGDLLHD